MILDIQLRPRHLRTDLHLHSTHSDGRATVPQLVQRARTIGFVFAVSDHYSMDMPMRDNARLSSYLDELAEYPVYRSVEVDLGQQLPITPENRSRLDYVIGSVHNVVMEDGERLPIPRGGEPLGGYERYMHLYVELFRRDVLAGTVQMIGHPTFLPGLSAGLHDRLWTPEHRRAFIDICVQSGVGLEISTRYSVPTPVFMREALEAGVRFAVGSDSHWLDRTADITLPLRYVEEFRIPEDRFFLPERVIEPPAVVV
jgi:histidinol phosphatase-like PHP family hydrolase